MKVRITDQKTFGQSAQEGQITGQQYGTRIMDNLLVALRTLTNIKINRSPLTVQTAFMPFGNFEREYGRNECFDYGGSVTFEPRINKHIRQINFDLELAQQVFPNLTLVLNRLADANNRYSEEDEILDTCIGLELLVKGCLAPEEGFRTTGHNIGIYIANLLGQTKGQKVGVYDDVKKGYDIRNDIVHGNMPKSKDHKAIAQLFYYFRLAIRVVILQNRQLKRKALKELIF